MFKPSRTQRFNKNRKFISILLSLKLCGYDIWIVDCECLESVTSKCPIQSLYKNMENNNDNNSNNAIEKFKQ